MKQITFHTKLVDGEYIEAPGRHIVVYVHAENCPIKGCTCEPTVKRIDEIEI